MRLGSSRGQSTRIQIVTQPGNQLMQPRAAAILGARKTRRMINAGRESRQCSPRVRASHCRRLEIDVSNQVPAVAIGGSASIGGGSSTVNGAPMTIGQCWAQLIASGSNFFQSTGATIFNMDAGTISAASPAQIGRVVNGVTITAEMVQQNQLLLNSIGAYCRANGIAIHVEAQLDLPPAGTGLISGSSPQNWPGCRSPASRMTTKSL